MKITIISINCPRYLKESVKNGATSVREGVITWLVPKATSREGVNENKARNKK